jgi:hypothetical protein
MSAGDSAIKKQQRFEESESQVELKITAANRFDDEVEFVEKDNFSDTELASGGLKILARPGTDVQAATDAEFELYVDIDQSQSDALALAGTYTDTLTLTYTDK